MVLSSSGAKAEQRKVVQAGQEKPYMNINKIFVKAGLKDLKFSEYPGVAGIAP